jgi:hypothetical protein
MSTDACPNPAQVVICTEKGHRRVVQSICAHHRDFPEIEGEGETPLDAAVHLSSRLTAAMDSIGSGWRRDHIARAIADVREYVRVTT